MKRMITTPAAALCVISLVSCSTMRSEYEEPALDVPQGWSQATPGETQALVRRDTWWSLFQDPQLDTLIERVLASNSDIEKATLSLKKALLEAGVSENNKVPRLGFSHSASVAYDIDDDSTDSGSSASLSLSYELDLWDRVNALADADKLAAGASYEEREDLVQDLVVTSATLYWNLAYLRQKLALLRDNLKDSQRIAELTRVRFDNGANTQLEVLESTRAVLDLQLQISQSEQELAEAENALSILLNQPLQDSGLSIEHLPEQAVPDIAAGLPADLLLRRPDIRAALYQLKSTLASRDAVAASYLPTISLTGSLNTSSSALLGLLSNPVASLGSGISLPFLQWREMQLNKDIAEVDYQMAVVDYRDTIYQAFEEVDNLLTSKQHYDFQNGVYREQYNNARETERIYQSKYNYGESDMIDWLNAIESRRSAESSLLENRYNRLVLQARLYQALGGSDKEVPATD
ncbi:TolC family protein [Granulosicoccaceae sp. 1_MG-2023]|nr:TolC family protein [Granulosicoccaceae sp. 1_MG-2023]